MRKALFLAGALIAAVTVPASAAPPTEGEAKLAKLLEGRVAGEPTDCLLLRDVLSSRIIDETAIVYETRGGTLYVNRPDSGRESLDQWDTLVTDTQGSRLCDVDVVRLYDTSTRMTTGLVFLGDFVPYEKPGD